MTTSHPDPKSDSGDRRQAGSSGRRRTSVAARRAGYGIAAVINAALLYAINVWPGWQAIPFLDSDTEQILGIVNASLVVGAVVNLVYLGSDAPVVKAAGDLVTTGFGLLVLIRTWQVFPFSFDASSAWPTVILWTLGALIVVTSIAMVVLFVALIRAVAARR